MSWEDGAYSCRRYDADGELVAQIVRESATSWAAYNTLKANPTNTGYLKVKGGFVNKDDAKAFVDASIVSDGWLPCSG